MITVKQIAAELDEQLRHRPDGAATNADLVRVLSILQSVINEDESEELEPEPPRFPAFARSNYRYLS